METTSRQQGIRHRFPNTCFGILDFRGIPVGVSLDESGYYADQMTIPYADLSAMYDKAKRGQGELTAAIFPSGTSNFPEARAAIILATVMDPAMDCWQALEEKFSMRQAEFGAECSVYI